jgi:hypothetical protein
MEARPAMRLKRVCDLSSTRTSSGHAAGIQHVWCLLGILLVLSGSGARAQDDSKALSPTESYKAALGPFTATRSQSNDLTDADKMALDIGMAQAARDCLALSASNSAYPNHATELFALGQLCIFGRQFEPARARLVEYLALSKPPQREQALLLLVQAFLGLKEPANAVSQVDSLLRDYPYDASIHSAIDQVIDETEGDGPYLNELALGLCAAQSAATLPLLASGRILEGKDGKASAATLFADAVRCDALATASGKPPALQSFADILQHPAWAATADRRLMQAVLERQQMVGTQTPVSSIHGHLVGANTLVPRTLSLTHGTVLLVPFTLWSPSMPEVARDVSQSAPQQPIYAMTSWHANTGGKDAPSSQVLEGLLSWRRRLPPHVLLFVVPDEVLSSFHADTFPAGILIREGTVVSNGVVSGRGAERFLFNLRDGSSSR